MKNQKLFMARAYEKEAGSAIPKEARPKLHLTPYVGWMNDPNGFSWYKGEYHLFYQYYPYDTAWNSMHWGHAVSRDLIRWEYRPAVLAPDEPYDSFGCFSGSAVELPDGRQLLMYTGVRKENGENSLDIQTQCIAVGDGENYEKYPLNPIIDESALPEGLSRNDFRDPKLWREPDGSYRCILSSCDKDRLGHILLFSSPDCVSWALEGVIAENDGRFGLMWECPDFFELDGKRILFVSPQDMLPEGFEYHNGNGTVCFIGSYDEDKKRFTWDKHQAIDYGIDFYAPQTILTPDGRRVMIGWMQNWDTCKLIERGNRPWFGQMSIPRELSIEKGRLYQRPIRELEACRSGKVEYRGLHFSGELNLDGIEGRVVELELKVKAADAERLYKKFAVRFAKNEKYRTSVSFRPAESVLKVDRKFSGSRRAYIHQRRCFVPHEGGEIKLRLIIDRYSVEVFVNDGEYTMTATILTDPSASAISFYADGEVMLDVTKYELFAEE